MSQPKWKPWGLTFDEERGLLDELAKDLTADIDRAERLIFAATKKAFERAQAEPLTPTFERPAS